MRQAGTVQARLKNQTPCRIRRISVMHTQELNESQHDHVFSQDQQRAGEKRTLLVVALTAVMMVVEIAAGLIYGSMALLAEGCIWRRTPSPSASPFLRTFYRGA